MNNENLSFSLKYADDTTLFALKLEKLQEATTELQQACSKWGMKVNIDKCKVLTNKNDNILIEGKQLENVDSFVYLGSVVPNVSEDVDRRICLASSTFGRLRKSIWNKRCISIKLKMRLYRALILPIATYASETWVMTTDVENKLLVFEMRCLRSILGISIRDRFTNKNIRKWTETEHTIIDAIRTRRLKWFGHVCRKSNSSLVYQSFKQNFHQRRRRGRPPKRWSDNIKQDTNLPLLTAERYSRNKNRWAKYCYRGARGQ